ncbi:MAG: N-acetylmuramoyl-L-alanine amidase [Firmicutes bacterium]|nr:N-acetylmuramoyl-L-alanine amidase [Bacillota bacterium]
MKLRSSIWATILLLGIYFFSGGTGDTLAGGGLADLTPTRTKTDGLKGKVIVIDPGHGGYNAGAVGASGKTWEKTNVLFIAKDLKTMLEAAGATVVMTRETDISPESKTRNQLETRVDIANQAKADLFVSIHNDANKDRTIVGTTTYYYGSAQSRRLAESVQKSLVAALGSRDHGVKSSPYYVLRHTKMPAILVEVGFISNFWEEKRLADPAYRYRASQGIFEGIKQYFSSSSFETPR